MGGKGISMVLDGTCTTKEIAVDSILMESDSLPWTGIKRSLWSVDLKGSGNPAVKCALCSGHMCTCAFGRSSFGRGYVNQQVCSHVCLNIVDDFPIYEVHSDRFGQSEAARKAKGKGGTKENQEREEGAKA